MARAAVLGRLTPRRSPGATATVREVVAETPRARTLVLDVPELARPPRRPARRRAPDRRGRLPGPAHLLDRLGARADALELTVELVDDGEVSPYLVEEVGAGDSSRSAGRSAGTSRGRCGDGGPLLLVGGGSGLVPLMAMLRHRGARGQRRRGAPARLGAQRGGRALPRRARRLEPRAGLSVAWTYTRTPPPGWDGFARPRRRRDARRGRARARRPRR